ncbi:uncharacterized protein METZ01_LOCUS493511 [marine metagenome]|uniref:Uncharacterized protein n=1 Tax=marine metagenome TaxID=408172 RepID=A0A383D7W5_9ZZZZ
MDGDPTGGMWIYLVFLIIPLARILPRLLRKYRNKNTLSEPASQDSQRKFFKERMPEPPRFREEEPPEPQPKSDKKDGWVGKDDFK